MTILDEKPTIEVGDAGPAPVVNPSPTRQARAVAATGITLLVGLAAVVVYSMWPGRAAVDERILVAGANGSVALLTPDSPVPVYSLDDAVATADRSRVYQAVEQAESTVLAEVDVDDGSVRSSRPVGPAGLQIRVVSPTGDAVALMPEGAGDPYAPEPRKATTIVVVRDGEEPVTHELDGNFEPEAFTADGSVLYLLEYWPAMSPDRYYVRSLDVLSGSVTDTNGPEIDLNPEMRGHARAQAIAPDGSFMYTLYTLDRVGAPISDGEGQMRWAFVHVISLTEDWSFCVFLPVPMGRSESSIGLAITPDGSTVYAVDSAADLIAVIDTESLDVVRTAPVGVWEPEASRIPSAVGPDGSLYLAIDGLVVAYDAGSLETTGTWGWSEEPVRDLDVSPDGGTLRVSVDGHVRLYDLVTGRQTASIELPDGSPEVDFIGAPSGPRSFITKGGEGDPLACAC